MAEFVVEEGAEQAVIDKARAADGLEPNEKPAAEGDIKPDDDTHKDDDASSKGEDAAESEDGDLAIPDKKEDDDSDGDDAGDDKSKDKPDDGDKVPDAGSVPQEFVGYAAEFIEKGELSAESRGKVRDALFGDKFSEDEADAYVDTYLAGLGAIAREQTRAAHDLVGGTESYKGMIEWAQGNLSEEDVTAFNDSLKTPGAVSLAIKGLHAQYTAAHGGFEPDHSNQAAASASGDPPLASRTKLREQMRDPRYKTDKAFREELMTKLRRSMESGRYEQM